MMVTLFGGPWDGRKIDPGNISEISLATFHGGVMSVHHRALYRAHPDIEGRWDFVPQVPA